MANVRRLATKAVHSGERHGRPKVHDTCTTPVRAAASACRFQHSQCPCMKDAAALAFQELLRPEA